MHHSDSHDCENADGCAASRAQHRSLARETTPCRNEDRKEHRDARNRAECKRRCNNIYRHHTPKCSVERGNCECCQGKSQSARLGCSTNGDSHWWHRTFPIRGSLPGMNHATSVIASPLHRVVPRRALHRPITRSIPEKMASICRFGILPTRSVNCRLSTVTSCDTFATESRSNPVCFALRSTFPGATDQRRLLVRATHTTVAIWLWFSGSDCTTTTGRR